MCKRRKLSVCGDVLKLLSHVPLPRPWSTSNCHFCPDVPLLSKKKTIKKTGCWCKVETWCLKSICAWNTIWPKAACELLWSTTRRPPFRGNVITSSQLLWCHFNVVTLMPRSGWRAGYRLWPLPGSLGDELLVKMSVHRDRVACVMPFQEQWKNRDVTPTNVSLVCFPKFCFIGPTTLNLTTGFFNNWMFLHLFTLFLRADLCFFVCFFLMQIFVKVFFLFCTWHYYCKHCK